MPIEILGGTSNDMDDTDEEILGLEEEIIGKGRGKWIKKWSGRVGKGALATAATPLAPLLLHKGIRRKVKSWW